MGSLALGGRRDLDTGRAMLRRDELSHTLIPRSLSVTWNPLAKQVVEPDTLFILDTNDEVGLSQGNGGFIAAGGWLVGTDVSWTSPGVIQAAGKFREGVATTKRNNGSAWISNDGLLDPTSFHIEGWWSANTDWTTLADTQTLFMWGHNTAALPQFITVAVNSGANPKITATYTHSQDPTVTSRTYTLTSSVLTVGQFPAGTEVGIALSMTPAGVLTLYVNGTQVQQVTGCVPARLFSTAPPGTGFVLLGSGTVGAEQMTMSDFRASRNARVPGVPITVTDANTITVNPAAPTGQTINQKLRGGLHRLKGEPAALVTNNSPSHPIVNVIRTDKMLSATPIKAGAVDATHPTLGQSGLYSYDWRFVDQTARHVVQDMGCELYLSIDACPQLLGGTVAPFTNTAMITSGVQTPDVSGIVTFTATPSGLPIAGTAMVDGNYYNYTNVSIINKQLLGVTILAGTPNLSIPANSTVQVGPQFTGQANFPSTVPNDFTALGHMAADLVYHLVTELGMPPVYCSIWNEPDGGSFWAGTEAQYLSLYQTVAPMIRGVAPSVKLGGPELGNANTHAAWIQDLINLCATNNLPLDFISTHPYSGALNQLAYLSAAIKQWSIAAGRSTPPELVNGESNYIQLNDNTHVLGSVYRSNDWGAAWLARFLMEAQALGVTRFINTESGNAWSSVDDSALVNRAGLPFAPFNVYQLWSMLKPNVISQTVSADPGIGVISSTDGVGTTVLVANLHYRKWTEPQTVAPQSLRINITGAADGTPVTCWMIDDERSNQADAGSANATLTQIAVPAIQGGATYVPMKARSVALIEV